MVCSIVEMKGAAGWIGREGIKSLTRCGWPHWRPCSAAWLKLPSLLSRRHPRPFEKHRRTRRSDTRSEPNLFFADIGLPVEVIVVSILRLIRV
jgi:hypothetical protein